MDPQDEYAEMPEDMQEFLRELREDPDALSLMRSLCIIPDVRDLSYDLRRANLSPDSMVQRIIYDVIDDVTFRDRFVDLLFRDYIPPESDS
jgi:hypothetical protein